MGWRRRYRSIPRLTEADLSDEGWARRRSLLEAQGIDVDEYIAHEVPRAFKKAPDIRSAQQDFEASGRLPDELRFRANFYKWAYRSGVAGAVSIVLVGIMSIAGAYQHARTLLFVVGGLCVVATVGLTTYSMLLFLRYLPRRKQRT
jgi:hypothetical protein